MTNRVTIDLPEDLVRFAEAKVAAGEYASLDAAIAAGVQGLQQADAQLERLLRDEVAPDYDAWLANPDNVLTEDEVFDELEAELDQIDIAKAS